MRRLIIALATVVAVSGAFLSIAAIESDSKSETRLSGKYVNVYSTDTCYAGVRDVSVQPLGSRMFVVFSQQEPSGREHDCWLPLESVTKLRVFDNFDDAAAIHQEEAAKLVRDVKQSKNARTADSASAQGIVTMRGKPPANATLRLHSENGLVLAVEVDNDGKYAVENVPVGKYSVTIEGDAIPAKFHSATKPLLKVDVRPGTNSLDFSLQ